MPYMFILYNSDFTPEEYDKMCQRVGHGIITMKEWQTYCEAYLYHLMSDHRDVLERLKGE